MLERIFGKRKVDGTQSKPKHIVPPELMKEIEATDGKGAKTLVIEFLKDFSRPQLMDFEDADQFAHLSESHREWIWEAINDEEWRRDWPHGKTNYSSMEQIVLDMMPISYKRPRDKNNREIDLDLNELEEKVDGIQKKLDRLAALVENTEVCMSGKTALNL